MYFANWGTHRLMLRIPAKRADPKALRAYFVGDAARAKMANEHMILDFCSQDEEPDYYYEESQGSLGALVPLRTELMRGDLRLPYLAWLLAVQADEVSDKNVEPPVPPGLSALTAAQAAFVEFLRIDEDLVAAAATASADTDDIEVVRAWAMALSSRAKDLWLVRAIDDPDLALGAELRRAFSAEKRGAPRPGRRVAELRAAAEEMRDKREQAERRAREKAKKAADAAKKKRLDALATRLDSAWRELDAMVDKKEYDAATKLAADLRDLAERDGLAAPFAKPFEEMRKRQLRRRGFFDRWKRENQQDR
jgi:hypothetical protein